MLGPMPGQDQQSFFGSIGDFSCGMFTKDCQGTYTWVHERLLQLQKIDKRAILGESDGKLPWAHHKERLRQNDEEVMDRMIPITFSEIIHRRGLDIQGFCHKSPIFREGSLIGIAGIFIDAPKKNLIEITAREKQCLLNLVSGLSAKQSATNLGLLSRKVEGYLESIRQKTGCRNQAQLIAFYHEHGC